MCPANHSVQKQFSDFTEGENKQQGCDMEMTDDKFTALYAFDTFGQLILRTAYCCVGNYSEAEDISQEVFLKLHENPRSFNDDEHLKAWLLRSTINRCINYKKSWRQKVRTELESVPESVMSVDSTQARELREAVAALPEKYSSVIFLYYYEGYSIKEIASILDKSENTVGSLLRRGRSKLRIEIEEA